MRRAHASLLTGATLIALSACPPAMAKAESNEADANTEEKVEGQGPEEATKDLDSVPNPVEEARLETREQAPYGRYVTDQDGMSLYLFEKDDQNKDTSRCDQTCAIAWPPYASKQTPQVSEPLDGDKLGSFERQDGTRQVTYNGWPLYYFSGDKEAGDALGQDVRHLGADWYLLTPEGERVAGERKSAPSRDEDS